MHGRPAKVLDPSSLEKLFTALDSYAEPEDVAGHRTRAFAYLMADGALRSGTAVFLDIDEVVEDPTSARVQVRTEVTMRSCEATKFRERRFLITENARTATGDYIKVARSAGWLADSTKLRGPLFIASYPAGKQPRLSQRRRSKRGAPFSNRCRRSSRSCSSTTSY